MSLSVQNLCSHSHPLLPRRSLRLVALLGTGLPNPTLLATVIAPPKGLSYKRVFWVFLQNWVRFNFRHLFLECYGVSGSVVVVETWRVEELITTVIKTRLTREPAILSPSFSVCSLIWVASIDLVPLRTRRKWHHSVNHLWSGLSPRPGAAQTLAILLAALSKNILLPVSLFGEIVIIPTRNCFNFVTLPTFSEEKGLLKMAIGVAIKSWFKIFYGSSWS